MTVNARDLAVITAQLGRVPRGVVEVAWRCPCGNPGVVKTAPRLPDGTPFPTLYYLTCPSATSACSTLEANGVMAEMTQRLASDPELAADYRRAHEAFLAERREQEVVPEIAEVSAGGMPTRVKCLHALAAHALGAGPGVNPLGDETVALLGEFWRKPCAPTTVHVDKPAPTTSGTNRANVPDFRPNPVDGPEDGHG